MLFEQYFLNVLAGIWFLICFNGYMRYAKARNYRSNASSPSLASEMHRYRYQWMEKVLTREMRVADAAAIANLEKSVAFFASTTMLILAGLITILGSTEKAIDLVSALPFALTTHRAEWEIKIMMLILLFAYAFFKFTWSLRQYGFVTIMIGGAPLPNDNCSELEKKSLAKKMASMASMAANNFNIGLRTYYFSISMLTWFIHPVLFMLSSTLIVFILFRREFKSSTLKILTGHEDEDEHSN
tara:strand:+ start:537 stop:1262 length:726 start_codon:yes stop_codon:yes gene_type:complete